MEEVLKDKSIVQYSNLSETSKMSHFSSIIVGPKILTDKFLEATDMFGEMSEWNLSLQRKV